VKTRAERTNVTGNCRVRERDVGCDSTVMPLGIVPDGEDKVTDLLGDQADQMLGNDALAHPVFYQIRAIP
jgi:hypothetical protein